MFADYVRKVLRAIFLLGQSPAFETLARTSAIDVSLKRRVAIVVKLLKDAQLAVYSHRFAGLGTGVYTDRAKRVQIKCSCSPRSDVPLGIVATVAYAMRNWHVESVCAATMNKTMSALYPSLFLFERGGGGDAVALFFVSERFVVANAEVMATSCCATRNA